MKMPNKSKYKMCVCTNVECKKVYELGFWGTGPKYCSRKCFFTDKKRLDKLRRDKYRVKFLKVAKLRCGMCGRKILTVDGFPVEGGKRIRRIRKYCSKRCMSYAQKRSKSGDKGKYFTVRVPLSQLKDMINT